MSDHKKKKAVSNHFARGQGANEVQKPTPQIRNGEKYYGANDVAKVIGVTRQTVSYWQQKGLFTADERTHDGIYLYEVGRVEQLQSVYRPDWNQQPNLRNDEPETFGDMMDGVFGDVLGGKTQETPKKQTETFADLQNVIADVLGDKAQDITPVAKSEPAPTATNESKKNAKREKYLKQIAADLKQAQLHFSELPARDKRGLSDETFQRLRMFYLPNWRHPNAPKTQPTPRFIVRLGSDDDPPAYNAILTPSGRKRFGNSDRWEHQKTLTAGDKLLFNPKALEFGTFFLTEGEINAASILQATNFCVQACALGGAGIFADLKRRLAELKIKPRIIILFDNDTGKKKNTGKENALKLQKVLADMGIAGLPVFLDDFLSEKQKETFDKTGKKNIDPNDFLQAFGDAQLKILIEKILDHTRDEFKRAEEEIKQMNLFKQEQSETAPTTKKQSTANTTRTDKTGYDLFRAKIMLDTIDPAVLVYSDWFAVNSACKNIGMDYSVVDTFNRRDPERYNATENQSSWNKANDKSFDIKTLHGIAKRFGYSEADARRQWYELHPELKPSTKARNIAEETQRELDDAIIFLESLSEEDFSADDAYNPDNIHAVALAQTYGFAAAAEKFFAVIKNAKALAQTRIKEADTGLIAPLDTDELARLGALANLHLETLRKNIAREVQALARAQKNFAKQQAEEQSRQKAVKARSERQARVEENIKTLIELRAEYKKNPSPELAKKMRAIIFNSCDVTTDRYTGEVKAVKTTTDNTDLIFTFDPVIDGAIGFDEFQQADVILKKMPWHKSESRVGEAIKDRDAAQLRYYLSKHYREFGTVQKVDDAIIRFSDKYSFHPVKDYFNNLPKWDGKPRAETLFIDFLGVKDTPYAREITLNWLSAAVARIFHPGCDYQIAPILHGNQGIGKGFIPRRLGGKWYGAIGENVDDSHAVDSIQNLWIGEFKEMKGMRKADINAIKAFIDTSTDNRRPPYGRRSEFFPRHIVFIITVNDDHFLSDVTGNRRFPVLECTLPEGRYIKGLTDEFISQVWAEVYHYYCELRESHSVLNEKEFVKVLEEHLELSTETKIQVENVAQRFMRDDGMTGEIEAFLKTKIPPIFIWDLLSKEERYKFYANSGSLTVYGGIDELIARRQARGGRAKDADIQKINELLSPQNELKTYRKVADSQIILYGVEYRQHICAAEIFNECFGNDKRKSMTRVHEILSTLTDWTVGKGTPHDPVYGNQRKVLYRNEIPVEPPTDDNPTAPPTHDDNGGNHDGGEPRELKPATETQSNNFNNDRQQDSHEQNDFWEGTLDLEDPPF